MSSLIIAGDTSGTITLQAPSIAGTTILTLPATTGTLATTAGGTAIATTATNLASGSAGVVPFQTGNGATSFTAVGSSGQYLTSAGTGTPTWTTITVPPAAAQPFVTQFTGGNTPPTMQSSGFGLI